MGRKMVPEHIIMASGYMDVHKTHREKEKVKWYSSQVSTVLPVKDSLQSRQIMFTLISWSCSSSSRQHSIVCLLLYTFSHALTPHVMTGSLVYFHRWMCANNGSRRRRLGRTETKCVIMAWKDQQLNEGFSREKKAFVSLLGNELIRHL